MLENLIKKVFGSQSDKEIKKITKENSLFDTVLVSVND